MTSCTENHTEEPTEQENQEGPSPSETKRSVHLPHMPSYTEQLYQELLYVSALDPFDLSFI